MNENIRLFVRHGNTFEANQAPTQVGLKTDTPLTHQGREQALLIAKHFTNHGIHPTAIYAGRMQRQTESAKNSRTIV
jgi:broad specificity phosphatase PhoE